MPQDQTPDPRSVLDPINVPRELKHQAWDEFYGATDPTDFQARFDKLNLPREAKHNLWDLKFNGGRAQVAIPQQRPELSQPAPVSGGAVPQSGTPSAPTWGDYLRAAMAMPLAGPMPTPSGKALSASQTVGSVTGGSEDIAAAEELQQYRRTGQRADLFKAGTHAISGVTQPLATAAAVTGGFGSPGTAAEYLLRATGASYLTNLLAKRLGASPEASQFSGALAGLLTAGRGAEKAIKGGKVVLGQGEVISPEVGTSPAQWKEGAVAPGEQRLESPVVPEEKTPGTPVSAVPESEVPVAKPETRVEAPPAPKRAPRPVQPKAEPTVAPTPPALRESAMPVQPGQGEVLPPSKKAPAAQPTTVEATGKEALAPSAGPEENPRAAAALDQYKSATNELKQTISAETIAGTPEIFDSKGRPRSAGAEGPPLAPGKPEKTLIKRQLGLTEMLSRIKDPARRQVVQSRIQTLQTRRENSLAVWARDSRNPNKVGQVADKFEQSALRDLQQSEILRIHAESDQHAEALMNRLMVAPKEEQSGIRQQLGQQEMAGGIMFLRGMPKEPGAVERVNTARKFYEGQLAALDERLQKEPDNQKLRDQHTKIYNYLWKTDEKGFKQPRVFTWKKGYGTDKSRTKVIETPGGKVWDTEPNVAFGQTPVAGLAKLDVNTVQALMGLQGHRRVLGDLTSEERDRLAPLVGHERQSAYNEIVRNRIGNVAKQLREQAVEKYRLGQAVRKGRNLKPSDATMALAQNLFQVVQPQSDLGASAVEARQVPPKPPAPQPEAPKPAPVQAPPPANQPRQYAAPEVAAMLRNRLDAGKGIAGANINKLEGVLGIKLTGRSHADIIKDLDRIVAGKKPRKATKRAEPEMPADFEEMPGTDQEMRTRDYEKRLATAQAKAGRGGVRQGKPSNAAASAAPESKPVPQAQAPQAARESVGPTEKSLASKPGFMKGPGGENPERGSFSTAAKQSRAGQKIAKAAADDPGVVMTWLDDFVNGPALSDNDKLKLVLRKSGGHNRADAARIAQTIKTAVKAHARDSTARLAELMDAGEGKPGAPELSPEDQMTVKYFHDQFDMWLERGQKVGMFKGDDFSPIEQYLAHLNIPKRETKDVLEDIFKQVFGGGTFGRGTSMRGTASPTKHRFYRYESLALEAGVTPVTNNFVEMQFLALKQLMKAVCAHEAFAEIKARGWAKWGNRTKLLREGKIASNWESVDDRMFQPMVPNEEAGGMVSYGKWFLPPDMARTMNNWLSPSLRQHLGPVGGRAFEAYRWGSNITGQALMALPTFHLTTETIVAMQNDFATALDNAFARKPLIAGRQAIRGVTPVVSSIHLARTGAVLRDAFLHPQKYPHLDELVNWAVSGGLDYDAPSLYKNSAQVMRFTQRWTSGPLKNKMIALGLNGVPAALEKTFGTLAAPMRDWYIPRLKWGAFFTSFQPKLEEMRARGASSDEILAQASRTVDVIEDRFGQLQTDNLMWPRWAKEILGMTTLFPGWNIGTARSFVTGMGKDTARFGAQILRGKPKAPSQRMTFFVAAFASLAVLNGLYQWLYTGKQPQGIDFIAPQNPDGTRVMPKSYGGDTLSLIHAPGKTLANKAHPFLRDVYEIYNNSDWEGRAVYNEEDNLIGRKGLDIAEHVIGKNMLDPIALEKFNRMREMGFSRSQAAITAMTPYQPAPYWLDKSNASNLVHELYLHTREQGPNSSDVVDQHNTMRLLRRALDTNNTDVIDRLADAGKVSPDMMASAMNARNLTPFQYEFSQLPLEGMLRVWNVATQDEKVQLHSLLQTKAVDKIPTLPTDQQEIMRQKYLDAMENY